MNGHFYNVLYGWFRALNGRSLQAELSVSASRMLLSPLGRMGSVGGFAAGGGGGGCLFGLMSALTCH